MPAHCSVVNCSDKYVHGSSISFHRFPLKRKDLLQKWKSFTQRSAQWLPSKWSAVCSRHFVESDFNCSNNRKTLKKNAVPTVRVALEEEESLSLNVVVEQVTSGLWHVGKTASQTEPKPSKQTLSSACEAATSVSGLKSTCRFCGVLAVNCVSFDNSFELFGMIQKCFPTLQILQDDTLPKDICGECCKQLERFSQFIDVVMLAQSELQRKYRRQLKIKQEPAALVRVKQEACESLDNLFPDELDMGMDEGCDHEPAANDENEQKLQFCDFPMLNAQDIINNCDIMEIINLDDPFINITDDADVAQSAQTTVNAAVLPSANEMVQAEMLTEEHNYAKEDWQPHQYKTEKLEGAELLEPSPANQDAAATLEPRSTKPIVTNVSQIPNPMLCELLPTSSAVASTSAPKPNIVVLNDSVVQSSGTFCLHNCSLCTAKFFSADSLNQHYGHTHAPMVSVPPLNISLAGSNPLKLEASALPAAPAVNTQTDYWQPEWLPSPSSTLSAAATQLPKKKIDILDMQRSFLHHNDLLPKLDALVPALAAPISALAAPDPQLAVVTANYSKLRHRYRRLQLECWKLKHSGQKVPAKSTAVRHGCRQCTRRFTSIRQLLRHKRLQSHFVPKPRHFASKCCGCSKLFRSRLGLRQHSRYICQSLPLRGTRLQSFKCRHCQAITFTHWRLYRRHELKCRPRHPKPKRSQRPKAGQAAVAACSICQKTFSSRTGLKQHRITHTTERRYKCGICARVFKRRNGLSQHIKGFHLQLKPHECPVCKHRYALKCDMLRCRHSQRRIGGAE